MTNSIKDVKQAMETTLKRSPELSAKQVAKYLKIPVQTALWLAEDLNHQFYK